MSCITTQTTDGIARLELDLPGEALNKISCAVRFELDALLDSLSGDNEVRGDPHFGQAGKLHCGRRHR